MDRSIRRFGLGRPFSSRRCRGWFLALGFGVVTSAMCVAPAQATLCGGVAYPFPYTDVAGVGAPFCPGIMEAYVLAVTKGTTPTTFSPNAAVTRTQMTTFLQRSIDQGLQRSSRRAALGQWWTPSTSNGLRTTTLQGAGPASFCKADGERIWVGNGFNVDIIAATSGELQNTISSSAANNAGILVANGMIYAIDGIEPSVTWIVPASESPFYISNSSSLVPYHPNNLSFDGDRIWTANYADGTLTIISVTAGVPNLPGTVVGGFALPVDVLFDGQHVWMTDNGFDTLNRLNSDGSIAQSVSVGVSPTYMAFDGANIWVPNQSSDSITVVQASTGKVVATISSDGANRLSSPLQTAFDGERILVTNPGNDSVTLFRAKDLSLISNVQLATGSAPFGACSDGINFWVTLRGAKQLLRL
jgi:YVTN family beta-propeller protein